MKPNYKALFVFVLVLVFLSLCISVKVPVPGLEKMYKPTRLGLDLKGGAHLVFEVKPTDKVRECLRKKECTMKDVTNRAKEIIRNRIDRIDPTLEPLLQMQGDNRIIVELPGVKDTGRAIRIIGETGLLEFKDENGKVILTGAGLSKAGVGMDQFGAPKVQIEFTKEGKNVFCSFTTQNVGRHLAIHLDKKVISNPEVREAICSGSGEISGSATVQEAQDVANLLNGGALPVPLERVEERTVGPTLGRDSIDKSVKAGIIGLSIVLFFMLLYYRLPGFVADIALIFYSLFAFAIFKSIPVTLTLPGIAGFILSIGMAVDANILIFERLKEELRSGKTLRAGIDAGFDRAWSSIFDSNSTTLITCGVLYYFGAGPIKGFALTLAIGVLVSMFTAVMVTRALLHIVVSFPWANHAALFGVSPQLPFMLRKNYNIVGTMKTWFGISLVIIIPGLVYLFAFGNYSTFPPQVGLKKGIDFTGGSLLWVTRGKELKVSEVRKIMSREGLGDSSIQVMRSQGKFEGVQVRSKPLKPEKKDAIEKELRKIGASIQRFESVGPVVGKELTLKAIGAIFWASLLIVIYLTFRFSQWTFGVCAVIALLHDVFVVTGIFAVLGRHFDVEVDAAFVTALLTVIGFSVHDTIVIFDRIRENSRLRIGGKNLAEITNYSVLQTFTRSINTSMTVVITVTALLIFGGPVLRHFNLALLIGIVSGTYSSIFNASLLLVLSENWLKQRKSAKTGRPVTADARLRGFTPAQTTTPSSPGSSSTSMFTAGGEDEADRLKKKKFKGRQRRR